MYENILTLKKIKSSQKQPSGIFRSFIINPFSYIFAFISYKLHFSPNLVSILSFLACLIACLLLLFPRAEYFLILPVIFWYLGAILDAADGDLARFTDKCSKFGGWFDSFLDRLKEFLIFGVFSYLALKKYNNEFYLLLGSVSVLTNVMSGYITDSKKIFIKERRKPEIKLKGRYSFGVVDTRDFIIIISLLLRDVRIALFLCSSFFLILLTGQIIKFISDYGRYTSRRDYYHIRKIPEVLRYKIVQRKIV